MGYKTYTCPIARQCGGCEWLAVPYPIQLRRKREAMARLFADELREDGAELTDVQGMEEPVRFRHKAASPYAPGPSRAQRHGHGHTHMRAGFYAAGTHRIVRCDDCLVEAEGLRQVLNDVARVADRLGVRPYAEDRGQGTLRHAVVRSGWATDDVMLVVVTNGELPRLREFVSLMRELHPELTTIVQNVNTRRTNAILGRQCRTLFGPGVMHDELLGCAFEVGPTSFYQTNPAQTERLYSLAVEGARLQDGMRVLDAYCGCGTIGICAAAAAAREGVRVEVTGVESVPGAVACAQRNARANGLEDRCEFVADDATRHMRALAGPGGAGAPDVVVMDPPRAGSTPEFLRGVVALAPERVVYVSCNPETQRRDVSELRQGGYRLEALTPVDMFPHTKHVETVATLVRRAGR